MPFPKCQAVLAGAKTMKVRPVMANVVCGGTVYVPLRFHTVTTSSSVVSFCNQDGLSSFCRILLTVPHGLAGNLVGALLLFVSRFLFLFLLFLGRIRRRIVSVAILGLTRTAVRCIM